MTYINNNWSTIILQNLSPYKLYTHKLSNLSHLQLLGSTLYVFLYQEEQILKLQKWASRVLKGTIVNYNNYTIYRIYLKDQKKVIWVKNLSIFAD